MAKFTSPLDGLRVAAPCPAVWEKMVGDERVRFCDECRLHVYNLSGMTRREAETLLTNTEGRLCVRFYRRADGSVLTRNCPVGLSALRQRVSRVAGAALSGALGLLAGLGLVPDRAPGRHVVGKLVAPPSPNRDAAPQPPVDIKPAGGDVMGGLVPPGLEVGKVRRRDYATGAESPTPRVRRHPKRPG